MYILSNAFVRQSEMWPIGHCLGLGHDTMVGVHVLLYTYGYFWQVLPIRSDGICQYN